MTQHDPLQADQIIEDLTFIQWVRGEKNAQTQEWEYRYQNHPGDRKVMDQAKLVVEGVPFQRRFISDSKVESAWQKLEAALDQTPEAAPNRFSPTWIHWKYAAAILVLIVAGMSVYQFYQSRFEIYVTDFGEREMIVLPDGSQVTMNANSTLRYQRRNPREVEMTGEIYFDIKKMSDPKATGSEPFIVHTPDLDIHVLGTEFNVNSRQAHTDVLLEEGRIELNMLRQGRLEMLPGDFVSYSLAENRILKQATTRKPEVITSWKEGVLLLDSISLASTLTLLEETYDIKTVIQNVELGAKILVGGVPNDNLEMCVKALRTIYNLEIELTPDSLIVR